MGKTHHVDDPDVAVGKDDGVGGRCYGQHEGEGAGEGGREHVVQWVHACPQSLPCNRDIYLRACRGI